MVNKDLQLDQYVTRTATKRSMVKCGANVRMFEHLKCEEILQKLDPGSVTIRSPPRESVRIRSTG